MNYSVFHTRFGAGALIVAAVAGHAAATELLVPAYFDPNDHASEWAQLTSAAGVAKVTAIFNPNSGPGTSVDPAYTAVLGSFRAAGGQAVAYVHTRKTGGSGLRSLSAVEAEIEKYRSFYSFDGIFVDEMSNDTDPAHVAYYNDLYAYIKNANADYLVVGNPGINVPQAYASAADVLVTYEDVGSNYAANVPDAWTQSATTPSFSNMPYAVAAGDLQSTLAIAAGRNTKYVYVTDDSGVNPYDSLPTYWAAEVDAVAAPEPAVAGLAMSAFFLLIGRHSAVRRSARESRQP